MKKYTVDEIINIYEKSGRLMYDATYQAIIKQITKKEKN